MVALGAILLVGGVMGLIHKPSFIAHYLGPQKICIPLAVGGGALILVAVAALGFGQRGKRGFKRASLFRKTAHILRVPQAQWKSWRAVGKTISGAAPEYCMPGSLGRVGPLGRPVVAEFGQYIVKDCEAKYLYVDENELPECTQDSVFVDMVVKGFTDHIVTLKINGSSGTVDYYDSTGLSINDRAGAIVRHRNKPLPEFIEELVTHFFKGAQPAQPAQSITISENSTRDQSDHHSCGVWVSMKKREWVKQEPMERDEVAARRAMMQALGQYQSTGATKVGVADDADVIVLD